MPSLRAVSLRVNSSKEKNFDTFIYCLLFMGWHKKKTAYLLRQTVSVGTLIFWKMPLFIYESPFVAFGGLALVNGSMYVPYCARDCLCRLVHAWEVRDMLTVHR